MTAALKGASVLLAEKEPVIGGTSAWSGGWLWIPRNPLACEEGIQEQEDAPLTYLQHEMGGQPADARLLTFLQQGPEMIDFFRRHTAVQFSPAVRCRIFICRRATPRGRSVTAQPFDGRLLGDWLHRLRPPLETISRPAWASPAVATWRTFLTQPAPRDRRCMPPGVCCATAGNDCEQAAGSIWLTVTR